MDKLHAEKSAVIDAPPQVVYDILADYHDGHPHILPPKYFRGLDVEQGGIGAGTVILVHSSVMGRAQTMRMAVSEPEPGRVLMETDVDSGIVSTFTCDPVAEGRQTRLTIATDWPIGPGLSGFMNRLLIPGILRRMYADELQVIARYLADRGATGSS